MSTNVLLACLNKLICGLEILFSRKVLLLLIGLKFVFLNLKEVQTLLIFRMRIKLISSKLTWKYLFIVKSSGLFWWKSNFSYLSTKRFLFFVFFLYGQVSKISITWCLPIRLWVGFGANTNFWNDLWCSSTRCLSLISCVPYFERINLSFKVCEIWNGSIWSLSSPLTDFADVQNMNNIIISQEEDVPNWMFEDFDILNQEFGWFGGEKIIPGFSMVLVFIWLLTI